MTNQEMSEILAEKIMGWHHDLDDMDNIWRDESGNIAYDWDDTYSPPSDIQQAIEALEKFCSDHGGRYGLEKTDYYHCIIYSDVETYHGDSSINLSEGKKPAS